MERRRVHHPRSPYWLRTKSRSELHGIAGRLDELWRTDGITDKQNWLLEQATAELGARNRAYSAGDRCTCRYCMSPFE